MRWSDGFVGAITILTTTAAQAVARPHKTAFVAEDVPLWSWFSTPRAAQ